KVRVLMYGASGTAADFGAGYLRLYLQHRFGDGGPGFIPLGRMNRWYRHNEVTVEASKGWRKEHAQWPKGRMDGHYGLLGASFASSSKRDWVRVLSKPEAHSAGAWSSAELQFLRQPGGGRMRVVVEGERPEITLASLTVATAADEIAPGYHAIALPPGTGAISVRPVGDGEVRLFGVVIERDGRGVVVDTLGINGTRAANQLKWNETIWRDAIARRKPALVTLSYGTNESVGGKEDVPLPQYREELEVVLTRLRDAAPDASCVLILPTDYPILDKDARELQPRPRLLEIMEIQRELGPAHGCGVWDGLAFMGGFGAMARWVHADPPLARGDYLHFTRRGSVLKSMVLSDALLLEYDWAADPSLTPVPLAAERGL
ncbi:MAG: hypothetical protein KC468_30560, partial [Myxococcales bacterium]|nr:hypothetical protein [Myxococcales bacterium]